MKLVDIKTWTRRESWEYFSSISQPFYALTYQQDVTALYDYAHEKGLSFYYCLVWAVTEAVNAVDAFRMTITPDGPAVLPRRRPSFTVLRKGEENFRILTMDTAPAVEAFCTAAAAKEARQTAFLDQSGETADLIYISCLPWLEVTGLTNERDFDADDAIPRISWGKYREEDGCKRLGMCLEVNHRLIDGVHIGRFAEALDRVTASLSAGQKQ